MEIIRGIWENAKLWNCKNIVKCKIIGKRNLRKYEDNQKSGQIM